MKANQITAIGVSIIAIVLLGFAFDKTYNTDKNIKDRCRAKFDNWIDKFDSKTQTDDLDWPVHVNVGKTRLRECLGID